MKVHARYGRILRQPGDKKLAQIFSIVSLGPLEKSRLLSVKNVVEKTYGFTQELKVRISNLLPKDQRSMAEYLRKDD